MDSLKSYPRYQLLANELRAAISGGDYNPGDKLPSEAELCLQHGVSRGTVVRAIEHLVREGIVHRRQGAGSFVARPSLHRRAGRLLSFSEAAANEGLSSTQTKLALRDLSKEAAGEFHCDRPALYIERLRLLDDVACAIHRSVVPRHIASRVPSLSEPRARELERPDFSLYKAFEAAGFPVSTAQERVATRLATSEECEVLKISHPAPVMTVFRRSYDARGSLLEAVEAVYQGEYYTFDFRLTAAPSTTADNTSAEVLSLGGRLTQPNQNRE